MGLDLYNGQIYSQPAITLSNPGSFFGDFAYSCADTSIYGLVMQNGVKALGKINPQTGVVTELPTVLNYDNFVMNSGGAIDPVNLVYYFQTLDTTSQIKMVGLSLLDGSVVSESYISSNGNYFVMYRIQNECYDANPSRLNPSASIIENQDFKVAIQPNPAQDVLYFKADIQMEEIEIVSTNGSIVQSYHPNEVDFQIPISALNNGVYIIRIRSKNSIYMNRFIKNCNIRQFF